MSRLTSVSLARAFKGTPKRHLAAAFVGAIIAALLIVPGTLPAAHADNGEPLFELSNGDLDFGELYLGESAVLEATLTNISGTDQILMHMAGGNFSAPGFRNTVPTSGTPSCTPGSTVAAGASCVQPIEFSPVHVGEHSGQSQHSIVNQAYTITFTGVGLAGFEVDGADIDFGGVLIGSPEVEEVTFTNVSDAPLAVDVAPATGLSPRYRQVPPQGSGTECTQGVVVQPGESCVVAFEYSPLVPNTNSSTAQIELNGVTYTIALTGYGVGAFEISHNVHDFGEVAFGDTARHEVLFKNISDVTQTLLMTGGGGVGPGYSTLGQVLDTPRCINGGELQAGDSCVSIFEFSPTGLGVHPGSTRGTINGVSYSVTLTGTGVATFIHNTATVDFGEVMAGDSNVKEVIFTNVSSSSQTLEISGGATPSAVFSDTGAGGSVPLCVTGVEMAVNDSCAWPFEFSPDSIQAFTGSATFVINGVNFSIALKGVGTDGLIISANTLDFGEVYVEDEIIDEVWFTNSSSNNLPLDISGGEVAGPDFFDVLQGSDNTDRCESGTSLEPNESCSWPLRFAPTTVGNKTTSFPITINGMERQITATGVGLAWSDLDSSVIDFGEVQIGQSVLRAYWIINVSPTVRTVDIAGGAIPPGPFANGIADPDGLPRCDSGQQLAPGEGCPWPVIFTPVAPGEVALNSEVTIDANARASHLISMTGVGVHLLAGTPVAPVATDLPGFTDDSFTGPSVAGIEYSHDGVVVAPGAMISVEESAYDADSSIATVVLVPQLIEGYELPTGYEIEDYEFTLLFSNEVEPDPTDAGVDPTDPTDPGTDPTDPTDPSDPGTGSVDPTPVPTTSAPTTPPGNEPGSALPGTGTASAAFLGLACTLILMGIAVRRSRVRA